MRVRLILFVILSLGLAFTMNAQAAAKVKLGMAIGVAPEYYLPVYGAEENGFFKRNGVDVEIVPFRSGAAFVKAMAGAALDTGLTASGSAVHQVSKGVPTIIVSNLITRAPFMIYVRGKGPIKQPEDLVGAKIGVPRLGSVSEFFGRAAVKGLGIQDKVKFVGAGGLLAAIAGLKSGSLDAIVEPPTVVANLVVSGEFREVVNIGKYLPGEWVEHVVIARRDFIKRRPNDARAVVRALLQSNADIKKNPRWAVAKMKSVSRYSDAAAKKIYNYIGYVSDGNITRSALRNVRDFLVEWGVISKETAPAVERMYTTDLLR